MGTSTDAILFWGYCWDEEDTYPWESDDTDDDDSDGDEPLNRFVRLSGLSTRASYTSKLNAQEKSGCSLVYHCSDDVTMYGVSVDKSVLTANRGFPQKVPELKEGRYWKTQLEAYCKIMGIKTQQMPRWWLVSNWG